MRSVVLPRAKKINCLIHFESALLIVQPATSYIKPIFFPLFLLRFPITTKKRTRMNGLSLLPSSPPSQSATFLYALYSLLRLAFPTPFLEH